MRLNGIRTVAITAGLIGMNRPRACGLAQPSVVVLLGGMTAPRNRFPDANLVACAVLSHSRDVSAKHTTLHIQLRVPATAGVRQRL